MIKADELRDAMVKANQHVPLKEIEKIINELDYRGNHKINYTEFLAATVSVKAFLTDERLMAIFRQFDTDGSGVITAQNIKEALNKFGQNISDAELKNTMQEHDIGKDGNINYEEFKTMMLDIGDVDQIDR